MKSRCICVALFVCLMTSFDADRGPAAQPVDDSNAVLIRIAPFRYENAQQAFVGRQELLKFASSLAGGRADAGERAYETERCDDNPACDVVTVAQVSREFFLYLKDGQKQPEDYPQAWSCPADVVDQSCPKHSVTAMKRMLRAHRRQFHP